MDCMGGDWLTAVVVKVKSKEFEQYCDQTWEGNGSSKQVAKANAMMSLLDAIKE